MDNFNQNRESQAEYFGRASSNREVKVKNPCLKCPNYKPNEITVCYCTLGTPEVIC